MGEYRKVLVAVDGSDAGTNALRQACHISPSCTVTAMTAYPGLEDTEVQVITSRESIGAALRAEALSVLDQGQKIAAAESLPLALTKAVRGAPFEAIVSTAQEGPFDLIVMGRRGRTRFERALMGSVTIAGLGGLDVLVNSAAPFAARQPWRRATRTGSPSSRSTCTGCSGPAAPPDVTCWRAAAARS